MEPEQVLSVTIDPVLSAEPPRPQLLLRLALGVIESDGDAFYAALSRRAEGISGRLDRNGRLMFALAVLPFASAEDWSGWRADIESDRPPAKSRVDPAIQRLALQAVEALLSAEPEIEEAHLEALSELLGTVGTLLRGLDESDIDRLRDLVGELLADDWTVDDDQCTRREQVHRVLRDLEASAATPRKVLRRERGRDLLSRADPSDTLVWLRGVARMSSELTRDDTRALVAMLPAATEETPALFTHRLWARVELAQHDDPTTQQRVSRETAPLIVKGLQLRTEGRRYRGATEAFAAWLELMPEPSDVRRAITALGFPAPTHLEAIGNWLQTPPRTGSMRTRNTSLLISLLAGSQPAERWATAFSGADLVEGKVIEAVEKELFRDRPHRLRLSVNERRRLVGFITETGVGTKAGRTRVARICRRLLAVGEPENNIDVVVRLCEVLDGDYEGRTLLSSSVAGFCSRYQHRLTRDEAAALAVAGVDLPSESFLTKNARKVAEEAARRVGDVARALGLR